MPGGSSSRKSQSSLSGAVQVRSGNPFGRRAKATTRPVAQSAKRREGLYKRRLQDISGTASCTAVVIVPLTRLTGLSCEEREWLQDLEKANFDDGMDVDPNVWSSLPPGEEGILLSNAGGEDELCRALLAEDGVGR